MKDNASLHDIAKIIDDYKFTDLPNVPFDDLEKMSIGSLESMLVDYNLIEPDQAGDFYGSHVNHDKRDLIKRIVTSNPEFYGEHDFYPIYAM